MDKLNFVIYMENYKSKFFGVLLIKFPLHKVICGSHSMLSSYASISNVIISQSGPSQWLKVYIVFYIARFEILWINVHTSCKVFDHASNPRRWKEIAIFDFGCSENAWIFTCSHFHIVYCHESWSHHNDLFFCKNTRAHIINIQLWFYHSIYKTSKK